MWRLCSVFCRNWSIKGPVRVAVQTALLHRCKVGCNLIGKLQMISRRQTAETHLLASISTAPGCQNEVEGAEEQKECPVCGTSFSGRRLEEAPISIPNPFTNGHKTPCAFLIAPAEDNTLREYDGGSDLHTGITDTKGVVYNYTKSGVRRDREGWEHCISIMLVQPDMYNLINQWDQYLEKFASAQMWDPLWQSFNQENHNCYSYTLMFINCVLAMQSKRALSKDEFTQTFILPRVKRASKYSTLCQEISQNHFYIVDSPKKNSHEKQNDEEKDDKSVHVG